MSSYRITNPMQVKYRHPILPDATFTISSNSSDKTRLLRQHSTPNLRRQLTFRSDSEEEYSDEFPFDESRHSFEMHRNRLFLYDLSPRRSKVILKSVIYQKLVHLVEFIIFLVALVLLVSFELLKRLFRYLHERRNHCMLRIWIPYASLVLTTFSGFYFCYLCNK